MLDDIRVVYVDVYVLHLIVRDAEVPHMTLQGVNWKDLASSCTTFEISDAYTGSIY